jgi:hypothetical protein
VTPELRPVQAVAWQKPAASAAPLAESLPPDPSDQATLGQPTGRTATPGQTTGQPTSQTSSVTPGPAQPEAVLHHPKAEEVDLWPLKLRLAERAVALPEIAANQNLEKWAESSDPVTARCAGIRLADRFKGPENRLEELIARHGPVEGPTTRLEYPLHGKFSLEVAEPALLALTRGLADQSPSPRSLSVLAALASKALRTEGAEDFSQRAISLLRDHVKVEGDLESALREGPVPVVDGQIVLGPERTASPEHRQLALDVLNSMELLGDSKGADQLEDLKSPDVARAVVEEITLGQPADDQILGMGLLLREATKRPALAALFQPHEAALLTAAPRFQAMAHRGRGVANFVEQLIPFLKSPMDEATGRAHADALLACSDTDAINWPVNYALTALLEKQPELAGAVGSSIIDSFQSRFPGSTDSNILNTALSQGWKPTPLQRDLLLSFMVPPLPTEAGLQITRYSYCDVVLNLAPKLGDLDGVVLPGPKGELLPCREALLEHLLVSQGDENQFILGYRDDQFKGKACLFQLIAPEPDPALEKRLLSGLPEQLPLDLSKASHEARNHLAILASIPLTPETRGRLDELLRNSLPAEQIHFEGLVKEDRERQIEAARAHLTSPDLTTRLEGAERMVELCVLRGVMQDQPPPAGMEPVGAAQASLATLSDTDQKLVATWLSNRMAETKSLDELTPRQLADFMLATPLAHLDATLESRLRAIAAVESKGMPAYHVREHLATHLTSMDHDRLRKGVADAEVPGMMQRLEKMQHWQMPEDFQAWAEGARGWSGELVGRYGADHQEDAYTAFYELVGTGKPEEQWQTLKTILTRVEASALMEQQARPELLGKALEIWRESRDRGDLDGVLEERGFGPPKSGGGVVERGGMVHVGGMVVRRRTSL